jgi:hypothetical protein
MFEELSCKRLNRYIAISTLGSSKELISKDKRRKTKEFRESIQRVKDFFVEEEEKHEFYKSLPKKNKK